MDITVIQNKIFEIRGHRVMLDLHLADLYQVQTRALKQAVKRNEQRFPSDFMFVLTKDEANTLLEIGVSQNVIPPTYNFGLSLPMAFTEQGVAMLSSVLRSDRAIEVNISIMRAFVEMRRMIIGYKELMERIEQLEISTDAQFNELYQALTELISKPEPEPIPRRPIGYNINRSGDE
ncbi:MAG: ORF6N domain-containing protein [Rikenellaceae bacterium]